MKKFSCPYCGVGCGLAYANGRIIGDKKHPASFGDVCKKPLYYHKVIDKGRIPYPMYREHKGRDFQRISWERAYGIIADKLSTLSAKELYFYLSGQLLTEDIYVINKFVKGCLKTNNIDANSRLCMVSAVAAYKMAFGSDGPPGSYEDIDDADSFVFIGSNAKWTFPVLFKKVMKRKRAFPDAKVVTIDPVRTETAGDSDRFIQINAGTDVVFLNAVLNILYRGNALDREFIASCTEGIEAALEEAGKHTLATAMNICGVREEEFHYVADLFAHSGKLLSFYCQGVNQSSNGTMKNLALLNLHLATGRVNAGGTPFSLTGQSNAMGGREVGYLVYGLPGYRDVRNAEDREYMERYWSIGNGSISPTPGRSILQAVTSDRTKLFWVTGTNPAVSMPNLREVRGALGESFLIVQDAYFNDTAGLANLLLPAAQIGEKDGVMTGSDRLVTLCERFIKPHGESKPDWLIFSELARRMGFARQFSYERSEQIFMEYRGATEGRLCDISGFGYHDLPRRWGGKWLYKDLKFPTPSGRARFVPAEFLHPIHEGAFVMLTGRSKNQWHTMTRTGKSHELLLGEEPYLLINPHDADELSIRELDTVSIRSANGVVERKALLGDVKKGHLFVPFGFPSEYGKPVNVVVSDRQDHVSGQPDLKFTYVHLSRATA
ncbi:MAG: molybdopterin-dependent oxidoreductase [Deltaproteobacteria bacterium]|nr:molybdopterin-dependent oxidoreductase [Deltaproteobacteria bacterium]